LIHGVRLEVAYDGTDFAGWQRQPKQRTVQGTLEAALDRMKIARSAIYGASRTDSGVHAEGQICSFMTDRWIAPAGWVMGLNGELPADVSVRSAFPVRRGYNPRHDTLSKIYRYLIYCGPSRDPLWRRRAWYVGPALSRRDLRVQRPNAGDWLDLDAMRRAGAALQGRHDFHAFRKRTDTRDQSVREMHRVDVFGDWRGHVGVVAIEVEGTAFMRHMMRILAGTLLDIGRHRMPPELAAQLLEPGARREEGGCTAPAHGLCLVSMQLGRKPEWQTG